MQTRVRRVALLVLLASGACTAREESPAAESAISSTESASRPEFVAVAPRNGASASRVGTACPENVRNAQDGQKYVHLQSDVVRKALAPGDSMRITSAKALYIPSEYRLGDPAARDTLHLDCQTMRRIVGS